MGGSFCGARLTGRGWRVSCVAGVLAASGVVEVGAAVCVGGCGGVDGGVVCVDECTINCRVYANCAVVKRGAVTVVAPAVSG